MLRLEESKGGEEVFENVLGVLLVSISAVKTTKGIISDSY